MRLQQFKLLAADLLILFQLLLASVSAGETVQIEIWLELRQLLVIVIVLVWSRIQLRQKVSWNVLIELGEELFA